MQEIEIKQKERFTMTTIQQATNVLTSKASTIEFGKEIGENIADLFGFTSDIMKSKNDKIVDLFTEQPKELLEIINNEEMSFGDRVGQINDKLKEYSGVKVSFFKGVELGTKIVDWFKGLFSNKSKEE